jgi:glyoxylase-like metal-dependent hydrolase (beta-lactamase superfamily II)
MGPRAVQITDEVFQVGGPGLSAPEDAAVYLISIPGHAALIDCGCGGATDLLLANVESAGVRPEDLELLLLTHCHFDHTGAACALRDRLGCTVVAHALDASYIERGDDEVSAATWYGSRLQPCPVDRKLGTQLEPIAVGERTITAIHIPGHSPGSVAYLMFSAGRSVLFAQDVHGPLHPSLLSDAAAYQASLRRLLETGADILCEGHFGIFEGREEVAKFIRRFMF